MVDITDEESARAWLETQPKQVCIAMAARAALRSVAALGAAAELKLDKLCLTVMRAVLIAATSGSDSTKAASDLEKAAHAAAFAFFPSNKAVIFAAVNSAIASANSAASSGERAENAVNFSSTACYHSDGEIARTAAYSAFKEDANGLEAAESIDLLFQYPVWRQVDEPDGLAQAREALLRFLESDPAKWDFWARWYRGMYQGRPMDWALQRAVALIPDEVWKAGPEAVAARIAEIERDFRGDPLDQDALETHVLSIAKASDFHADAAESVATTLDTAIRAYIEQTEANDLPEGFAQFERLKSGFRAISVTLRQSLPAEDKTAELQAQINDLHGIVGTLQRELADARAQLVDARLSALEAERQRRSGSALLTTLASFATIGSLGLGVMNFFGVKAEDFGYDTLRRDAVALAEDYAAAERSARPVPRPTSALSDSPRPQPRRRE